MALKHQAILFLLLDVCTTAAPTNVYYLDDDTASCSQYGTKIPMNTSVIVKAYHTSSGTARKCSKIFITDRSVYDGFYISFNTQAYIYNCDVELKIYTNGIKRKEYECYDNLHSYEKFYHGNELKVKLDVDKIFTRKAYAFEMIISPRNGSTRISSPGSIPKYKPMPVAVAASLIGLTLLIGIPTCIYCCWWKPRMQRRQTPHTQVQYSATSQALPPPQPSYPNPTANQSPPYPTANQPPPYPTANQQPPYATANQPPPYPTANQQPPYATANQQPPYPSANQQPPYPTASQQPPYSTANQPPPHPTANQQPPYSKQEYFAPPTYAPPPQGYPQPAVPSAPSPN